MKEYKIWDAHDAFNEDFWEEEDGSPMSLESAIERNDEYLNCEKSNLRHLIYEGGIICFGSIGLWNGRRDGYRIIHSGKVSDCLTSQMNCESYLKFYVTEDGEFEGEESHHDGTNSYTFRAIKEDVDLDEVDWFDVDIDEISTKIGYDIAKVYGWTMKEEVA